MKLAFLSFVLVIRLPQLLTAQSIVSDPRPFYVELRSAYNQYEIHYLTTDNEIGMNAFPVSVGYYVTPRLTIQLDGTYSHISNGGLTGTRLTPDGVYSSYYNEEHKRYAIPVLVRYSLLKRHSRLQIDALVGVSWAYDSFVHGGQTYFTSAGSTINIPLATQSFSDHGSQFFATAGLGLRWVFNRHFELVGDFSLTRNLQSVPEYIHQQVTGNPYGLTSNRSLALRYRFNWGKPAPKPAS